MDIPVIFKALQGRDLDGRPDPGQASLSVIVRVIGTAVSL